MVKLMDWTFIGMTMEKRKKKDYIEMVYLFQKNIGLIKV